MSKKCLGCGAVLQNSHADQAGYVKNLEQNYCQSCFRLRHYRDFKRVQAEVNDSDTLAFIESFNGHIFWVCDILRLSQSLHSGLIRSLRGKRVVLLLNKMDLLPKSISLSKLKQKVILILKDERLELEDILFVSAKEGASLKQLESYLEDDICAFVGNVNAGKSSLLNRLFANEELSISPVPSTTAQVIELKTAYGKVYDTPGLRSDTKIFKKLNDDMIVRLAPQKRLKAQVFQIYEPQSFVLGNLAAITVYPKKDASVVSYIPVELKRISPKRIEANLKLDHEFMLQDPHYKKKIISLNQKDCDLELFDIGFISISGMIDRIELILDESIDYALRRRLF